MECFRAQNDGAARAGEVGLVGQAERPNGTAVFGEAHGETLSTIVLRAMREAVIDGRLAPGESINEADLSKQFRVSRAPIREAIRQLESEGLVVRTAYRGTVVSSLSVRTIEELQSFRRMIEVAAAERAMCVVTDDDVAELAGLVDRMRAHSEGGDSAALSQADMRFHTRIVELGGNALLLEVWTTYVPRIRRVLALRNRMNPDARAIMGLHDDLLRAFVHRDPDLLHNAYDRHGTDLVATLRHLFEAAE